MGFLGSIGKAISRGVTAVATGGASEILRATGGSNIAKAAESVLAPTNVNSLTTVAQLAAAPGTGGASMALDIGGILGGVGGILGQKGNIPALQTTGQLLSLAGQYLPAQAVTTTAGPVTMASNQSVQIIPQGAAGPSGLTKDVFNAGLKVFNAVGIAASAVPSTFVSALKRILSALASLARRTPVGTLVGLLLGLGLTAYEANLLTAWYATKKKSRRMNPANAKALRRASRRIKSFHKLCVHTDVLKTRRRSSSRCGTCRRSPCSC